MKRNLTKKIISLVLSVLMLSSCWVFAPIEAEAIMENAKTWASEFPRDGDPAHGDAGFGLIAGKCVNGVQLQSSLHYANTLFFLDAHCNEIAYCIEIGQNVVKGTELVPEDNELTACGKLLERLENAETKDSLVGLTAEKMRNYLRSILGYGYHYESSDNAELVWKNIVGDTNQRNAFAHAYATQILVWELVSGERDANFDHIAIPNGCISIYDHCIKYDPNHPNDPDYTNPLKADIDKYYKSIEANVKNSTPDLDPSIKDKNFKLEANYNTRTMEVTIPDSNGLFANTKEINGLPGAILKHENGELKISVPFIYAKVGTYTLSYYIQRQVPKEIRIYLPDSTQDMVAATGGTGGLDIINEEGTITIEIPHHHEWIPHLILPTCTTEGLTCMVCTCGEIYTESITPALEHDHSENSAWVIGYQPTCTEPGEEVKICNRCNAVIDSRPIEPLGHNKVWVIETEASADHNGQMVAHCTKCGNRTETKQYKPHTHTAEGGYEAIVRDASCANDGLMGTFCGKCGVCFQTTVIPGGHSETLTWVTTLQPTCTADGESSGYCSDCGTIAATKAIAATGHGEGTWMTSVEAYCGLKGEEICLCDKCGEIIGSRETAALSHDEGVWKVTTDPTCELEGEKTKSCTRCGQVIETEAIAALGHDNGVWKIDIEATADIDGSMGRYCTRCSMVLETKTFTLHTHEAGYQTTLLQNTCTRDGEKGTACKICNAVFAVETVPMMGHDYSDFYMETNGTHSKSCSRCHYVYTENCAYTTIESVEATCTTSGYKTHKCTVCTHTYTDSFVPAFGHTMGKWATEGKSTHMRYCTDCGVMEISKHVWGEYFLNNDGDIIEEGSKTRSCLYCSESQTVGKPASIITSTYKATMNLLEFVINLLGNLIDLFGFLAKILG